MIQSEKLLGEALNAVSYSGDRTVENKLLGYSELIFTWHKKANLVAANTLEGIVKEHVVDAIYLSKKLPAARVLVDIGSGAGLPGVVLALLNPKCLVHLVEPRAKLISFLKEVKMRLEISNIEIHECRIEDLEIDLKGTDTIMVSRAFSPMNKLFDLCSKFLSQKIPLYVATGEGSKLLEDTGDYTLKNLGRYHPKEAGKILVQF